MAGVSAAGEEPGFDLLGSEGDGGLLNEGAAVEPDAGDGGASDEGVLGLALQEAQRQSDGVRVALPGKNHAAIAMALGAGLNHELMRNAGFDPAMRKKGEPIGSAKKAD